MEGIWDVTLWMCTGRVRKGVGVERKVRCYLRLGTGGGRGVWGSVGNEVGRVLMGFGDRQAIDSPESVSAQ